MTSSKYIIQVGSTADAARVLDILSGLRREYKVINEQFILVDYAPDALAMLIDKRLVDQDAPISFYRRNQMI